MTSDFSAMTDLSKYDCFRVKESPGQTKYELFSISRSDNCDLKLLRTKLWEKFGIPIDRCISYFDEDDDQVPINLECEFDAALQLTRKATTVDTTILLIVGNFSANNLYWKMSPNEHKLQTEICKELNASMLHYWHSSSPPLWFTTYMESMKKDIVATITSQVLKNVTEILNKRLLDMLVLSKEQSIFNEKNQIKPKSQDDESNDNYISVKPVNESVNANTEDDSQIREISTLSWEIFRKTYKTQNTARLIAEDMRKSLHQLQMELYTKLELYRCFEKAVDEHHQLLSQITTDNLDSNSNKTGQVNLPAEPISEKGFSNTVNTLKTENELRMSCSITGHQMLDKNRSSNDISRCNKNLSDEEKEKEDESFEIIQMPDPENSSGLFVQREESQHNSSRDSPSFELVSETSSTRVSPPCSIYMNEDHFSTFEEEHLCTPVCKLRHLMDFHNHLLGRRFDPHCYYSMTALKLYSTMTCPSKLLDVKQSEERKSPQSPKCPINKCMNYGAHDDMKDSHASYLSVPSYCGSETQSQCSVQSHPSNDVTQSFHSHTTSIADTSAHVEPWNMFRYRNAQNKMEHSIVNEDVQTATKDNRDIPSCGMCWRCLLTVVAPYTCGNKECVDCNYNLPEILEKYFSDNIIPCTSHNNTTQSKSDQPNEFSEKSKTSFINELNELGTVDPVHILPETLVTAAAQVGCFAYDTAREMFDKLRAHTKEEPAKRQDEIKCDNRKPRIKTDSKNC